MIRDVRHHSVTVKQAYYRAVCEMSKRHYVRLELIVPIKNRSRYDDFKLLPGIGSLSCIVHAACGRGATHA